MYQCVYFKSINVTEKHSKSSIDLKKPLKTQKAAFFCSLSLSLFSHFLFAQLFIKINFPNGYSSACFHSFSFFFFFFFLFFSWSPPSFYRLLLWAYDTRRIELDSPLSIVIRYFSMTYAAHSFFRCSRCKKTAST